MVFVSDGSGKNEEIYVDTADVLLLIVIDVFGPGIVRDVKGGILTRQSGSVEGQYTWSSCASGEEEFTMHAI